MTTLVLLLACSPGVSLDVGEGPDPVTGTTGTVDTAERRDTGLEHLPSTQADLFDDSVVLELHMAIGTTDMVALDRSPYEYVPAELTLGDATWTVGVRLKGSSSYQPVWEKPNWKIDSDRYVVDQRVHGVKKFNLHNNMWDASHMAEALSYRIFRDGDNPAPRVGFANLWVNGDNYGLHTLVEAPGDGMLERWVDDPAGNLYEANNCDFDDGGCSCFEAQELDEGDHSALEALCAVARLGPDGWEAPAREKLDWDRFLGFVATEIATFHWDGYSYDDSNFRAFHEPTQDRWFWIPWSTDLAFGWAGPRTYDDPSCGTYGTDPRMYDMGIFASRCQQSPTCAPELLAALDAVAGRMEGMAADVWIDARVDLLRPYVQADPRDHWGERWFDSQSACIKALIGQQPQWLRDWAATTGF